MATELETLKQKKKAGKATATDLTRLKQLQDGEPLSKADLAEAQKREVDRAATDKKAYEENHILPQKTETEPNLDIPAEHPRIQAIKQALTPFTHIEVHDSRPNEFVLFHRGITITAGDIRKARKAMTL